MLLFVGFDASSQTSYRQQKTKANDSEAEIKAIYTGWEKANEARDIEGIMSIYAPRDAVVAYGMVAPLQHKEKDAYRKDCLESLAQYDGPTHVEYRDMRILISGDLAINHLLKKMAGELKSSERSDVWLRATSGYAKSPETG